MLQPTETLQALASIDIDAGNTKRMHCPFCGGRNTFTISKLEDGATLWNCYRDRCPARGGLSGKLYPEELKKKLDKTSNRGYTLLATDHFSRIK